MDPCSELERIKNILIATKSSKAGFRGYPKFNLCLSYFNPPYSWKPSLKIVPSAATFVKVSGSFSHQPDLYKTPDVSPLLKNHNQNLPNWCTLLPAMDCYNSPILPLQTLETFHQFFWGSFFGQLQFLYPRAVMKEKTAVPYN